MNQNKLFERLNVFTHTVYHSDGAKFVVWDQEKKNQLYIVKETKERFAIFDPGNIMLADSMTENKVLDYIELDMNVGSPLPNSEIVSMGEIDTIDTELTSGIRKVVENASKRQGSSGISLLQDLAARQKIRKKTSGMVKKKRKFDLADLDLEDDE